MLGRRRVAVPVGLSSAVRTRTALRPHWLSGRDGSAIPVTSCLWQNSTLLCCDVLIRPALIDAPLMTRLLAPAHPLSFPAPCRARQSSRVSLLATALCAVVLSH